MMTIAKRHNRRGDVISLEFAPGAQGQWLLSDDAFIRVSAMDMNIQQLSLGNHDMRSLAFKMYISGGAAIQISNHGFQAQHFLEDGLAFFFRSKQIACA